MAVSKTYTSPLAHSSTRYWIVLIVKETKVDKTKNQSTVFFDLRARSDPTWDLQFSGRLGYIEVNDERIKESYTNLSAWDGDGGAYDRRICSVTKTFNHDSSGKLSLKVKGYYDYSGILISNKWWLSAVSTSGTFSGTTISTKPTVSVSIKSQEVESASITWKSDIAVDRARLYDANGNIITTVTVDSKKTGTLTATGLSPGNSYTFKVAVRSTSNKWSDKKSINVKTTSTSSITSSVDLIFGNSLPVTKTNNTGLVDDLYFYVNNTLITSKSNVGNKYTLSFTQTELDTMYKLFGKGNTATTKLTIVTKGATDYSTSKTGTLTLTGIAKTVHVGVGKTPKRGMIWVGVKKVPKRGVIWTGTSSGPKRGI